MRVIVEGVKAIVKDSFDLIDNAFIKIEDGYFKEIKEDYSNSSGFLRYKAKGMLMIPGLINAHIHIGDSFFKDLGIGKSLKELFKPVNGLKHKLLSSTHENLIIKSMRSSMLNMLRCGITTFSDFREGGKRGIMMIKKAMNGLKIRAIILGRPDYYFDEDNVLKNNGMPEDRIREVNEILDVCDGIGLSGPNEYTDKAMRELSKLAKIKNKICAIHACEDKYSMDFSLKNFNQSEVERAIKNFEPDFIVHLTQARDDDIELVSKANIPIVCCPRANSILGLGFPPIIKMMRKGILIALGTDNVMLNSPDLFREMDYTSRILRALERDPSIVSSKDIFRMVTINSAKALKLDKEIGTIEEGKKADAIFIKINTKNLESIKDPINAIVHRVRPDDIQAVMINGDIVYGSLKTLA
ncbi:MAG: amidohydrolase family protein [Nitrososphaerales archaeon]